MSNKKKCWVIGNGSVGVLNQALGLAEALGVPFTKKTFIRKFPYSLIPISLVTNLQTHLTEDSDKMDSPWPDLLIASGSKSVSIAQYIKKASNNKTYVVYVQDPRISSHHFDLIFSMYHDTIEGKNVYKTNLSLHRVTDKKLKEEKKKFAPLFHSMPKPFNAIIIGGDTKRYKMNENRCNDLFKKIKFIIEKNPGTTLITPSRRTPEYMVNLLKEYVEINNTTYLVDLKNQENPYFAILALADKIFVTNDSVSMISEACAAGKEVYILKLLDINHSKLTMFANHIVNLRYGSIFNYEKTKKASIVRRNETEKAALILKKKLIEQRGFTEKNFKR